MGCTVSEPLPDVGDIGYVCIIIESLNSCRLIHATKQIVEEVSKMVSEISNDNAWSDGRDTNVFQLKFPNLPFGRNTSIEVASLGNLFVLRLLEIMHNLGYEYVLASDLSSIHGQSSLFFKLGEQQPKIVQKPILCIAPGHHNKLVVLCHDDVVINVIKDAIKAAWPKGIELEKPNICKGEAMYEFHLKGNPWIAKREDSTLCRKLLLELIRKLSSIGYSFHANVNINDDVDSMYFIKCDPTFFEKGMLKKIIKAPHVSMLSLNRLNRFTLINYDHDIATCISMTVTKFWRTAAPVEVNYFGSTEFQLNGTPLLRSGDLSILTRQLMCFLLSALLEKGYDIVTTLDISWKEKDKSIFILEKLIDSPTTSHPRIACISLDDNGKVRLINFPFEDRYKLRDCLFQHYIPGVFYQNHRSEDCHDIVLNGSPWSHSSSQTVHSRSVMTILLKELYSLHWVYIAAADVPAKFEQSTSYPVDVHCWFFKYNGEEEVLVEDSGNVQDTESTTFEEDIDIEDQLDSKSIEL